MFKMKNTLLIVFMFTLIIPLLKDKKGDITSKDNYRPIAITSIFSKVMELILLSRYKDLLCTNDNQFGYKEELGSDMCILTFKEVVNYYRFYSSNVYVCYIDASKAFDRVNHWHLFSKLIERGIPLLIVRLLSRWYSTQAFAVKWSNNISSSFKVVNGVRQGSILSPKLFNAFIDELSTILNNSNVGCHLNNICYNNLMYADDAVLLSPSPSGLQVLLKICEDFAKANDMVYNSKKTFCMCIKSKNKKVTCVPNVVLDGTILKWISDHKYLGVLINEHLKDDEDLKRQMKSIYCKGNTLLRKFGKCSDTVKIQLFQSFCSNLYCAHLWNDYKSTSFKQVEVSYNNVFRYLLNVRERCSISQLFLSKGVDSFNMLRRKAIYGFLSRVNVSHNMLVKTLTNSMYFIYASDLYQSWQKALYIL